MRILVYEYACALAEEGNIPDNIRREGRAMRRALIEDLCRAGFEVRTLDGVGPANEYHRFCELLCQVDAAWIIAPESEEILVSRCQWVEQAEVRLLGTPAAILSWLTDKWQQYLCLRERGIPVPTTWTEPPPVSVGPCVWKPRRGAGSQQVRRWDPVRQYLTPSIAERFLWQQYVRGLPASVACLCGPCQKIVLRGATQRLSGDGEFRYQGGTVPLPAPLERRAQRLASMTLQALPDLLGYVGIDLVLGSAEDGSEDYVIEINPRLTTSYLGQRALCRHNLAQLAVLLCLGETVSPPDWHDGWVEFDTQGRVRRSASPIARGI
jgi:predicted ATP-grasp superfamily ATP-dependent carboligase